jgi:methylated-DNA-[protein]-cysteine S-methyltransferase
MGKTSISKRESRSKLPASAEIACFPSDLGWMALLATPRVVMQVVSAQPSAAEALAALDPTLAQDVEYGNRWQFLVKRLQDFASGRPVDFSDVPIDEASLAPFQKRVVRRCRAIPYGQTRSYGELAALAGSPRAARAVGSTMAANRFGLIVPCHRVINADGSAGSFGTPDGARTKIFLLKLEQIGLKKHGKPPRARRRTKA